MHYVLYQASTGSAFSAPRGLRLRRELSRTPVEAQTKPYGYLLFVLLALPDWVECGSASIFVPKSESWWMKRIALEI